VIFAAFMVLSVLLGRDERIDVAVIHAPAVFAGEVLTHVAARERRRGTESLVALRVQVDVMDADRKRIAGLPREAERRGAADGIVAHGRHFSASPCKSQPAEAPGARPVA